MDPAISRGDDAPVTTTSTEIVDALVEWGVEYIFGNLGSDHPGLIEALSELDRRRQRVPRMILCPHEMSALSAAQGYAMATGRAQAVFVHTDVGTANLGGSVHNAARTRVPVLIFAGRTPITLEGELAGTRDSYINHLQDATDQHALVRPYVKWDYELRTGTNARQIVYRSMQLAGSSPAGPVYVTASREVLAERVAPAGHAADLWGVVDRIPLSDDTRDAMLAELATAQHPVIVTTYLGRNPRAVEELVRFAQNWAVPVVEVNPTDMNFPANHPLHLGYNADELVARADWILAVDTDVPWVHVRKAPQPDARVYVMDPDPLKEDIPLWYMPARRFIRADAELAFQKLNESPVPAEADELEGRRERIRHEHDAQREAWRRDAQDAGDELTAARVGAMVAEYLAESDILINEAITSAEAIFRQIPRTATGTLFANGGSSLGWSGGGALGLRLARPDRTVVNVIGDGSFLLSVPSSTYWMARRYDLPTVTVVLNNAGWNATKQNVLRQYPAGSAQSRDQYWVNLAESADLAAIAEAAGGALARSVATADELREALDESFDAVAQGRSAVIDVALAPISRQKD